MLGVDAGDQRAAVVQQEVGLGLEERVLAVDPRLLGRVCLDVGVDAVVGLQGFDDRGDGAVRLAPGDEDVRAGGVQRLDEDAGLGLQVGGDRDRVAVERFRGAVLVGERAQDRGVVAGPSEGVSLGWHCRSVVGGRLSGGRWLGDGGGP